MKIGIKKLETKFIKSWLNFKWNSFLQLIVIVSRALQILKFKLISNFNSSLFSSVKDAIHQQIMTRNFLCNFHRFANKVNSQTKEIDRSHFRLLFVERFNDFQRHAKWKRNRRWWVNQWGWWIRWSITGRKEEEEGTDDFHRTSDFRTGKAIWSQEIFKLKWTFGNG